MTPYIFINLGFIQIAIGAILWANGHVIENHTKTTETLLVNKDG